MSCPHCRWPHRIASTFETRDGIVHDASYCGRCGRTWLCQSVEEASAQEERAKEAEGPPAPRQGKPMTKLADAGKLSIEEMQRRLRERAQVKGYDHAKAAANDTGE